MHSASITRFYLEKDEPVAVVRIIFKIKENEPVDLLNDVLNVLRTYQMSEDSIFDKENDIVLMNIERRTSEGVVKTSAKEELAKLTQLEPTKYPFTTLNTDFSTIQRRQHMDPDHKSNAESEREDNDKLIKKLVESDDNNVTTINKNKDEHKTEFMNSNEYMDGDDFEISDHSMYYDGFLNNYNPSVDLEEYEDTITLASTTWLTTTSTSLSDHTVTSTVESTTIETTTPWPTTTSASHESSVESTTPTTIVSTTKLSTTTGINIDKSKIKYAAKEHVTGVPPSTTFTTTPQTTTDETTSTEIQITTTPKTTTSEITSTEIPITTTTKTITSKTIKTEIPITNINNKDHPSIVHVTETTSTEIPSTTKYKTTTFETTSTETQPTTSLHNPTKTTTIINSFETTSTDIPSTTTLKTTRLSTTSETTSAEVSTTTNLKTTTLANTSETTSTQLPSISTLKTSTVRATSETTTEIPTTTSTTLETTSESNSAEVPTTRTHETTAVPTTSETTSTKIPATTIQTDISHVHHQRHTTSNEYMDGHDFEISDHSMYNDDFLNNYNPSVDLEEYEDTITKTTLPTESDTIQTNISHVHQQRHATSTEDPTSIEPTATTTTPIFSFSMTDYSLVSTTSWPTSTEATTTTGEPLTLDSELTTAINSDNVQFEYDVPLPQVERHSDPRMRMMNLHTIKNINSLACPSDYKKNGCWKFESKNGKSGCVLMSESECISLHCGMSHMQGIIKWEYFNFVDASNKSMRYLFESGERSILIGDSGKDECMLSYDKEQGGFPFNLMLGECDMDLSREPRTNEEDDLGYLAFSQTFRYTGNDVTARQFADIKNGIQFKCLYDASSTTNSLELALNLEETKQIVHQNNQVGNWGSQFDMLYFTDDKFKHPQISNFELGTDMFVRVHWNDEVKPLSPIWNKVQFYIDSCSIKELI